MTAPRPVPRPTTLVVGLGSADRGDDAVGGHVARAVAALVDPGPCVVVEHEDPTDLIELWTGHDRVVVVDATWSGGPPGTLHLIETGAGRDPLPEAAWARTGRGGTHAFGLAAAVELARVLRRLPGAGDRRRCRGRLLRARRTALARRRGSGAARGRRRAGCRRRPRAGGRR